LALYRSSVRVGGVLDAATVARKNPSLLTIEVGTIRMKVQLIVVQGKPEGKSIPLLGPRFKIGRGETCHLRPNSELVSREHAEFVVDAETVSVSDLGSRNGTLVNGKALTGPCDLVQVGPLTFAVSIQGAPEPAVAKPVAGPAVVAAPAAKPSTAGLDDVSIDEIDSWLVSDNANPTPDRPSGVYGGDTITISAFKENVTNAAAAKPAPAAPAPAAPEDNDEEYERLSDESAEAGDESDSDSDDDDDSDESDDAAPEDMMDESNPFYVAKKKKPEEASGPAKPVYTDTSDAAKDILSKLLERRRNTK
jgi:hypothetical protein